jgi:hypothetical protein
METRSAEKLPGAGAAAAIEAREAGDTAAVDAALVAWRSRAAQIALVVVAAAHLPVIVLGWLGQGPPMAPLAKAIGIATYLVVAGAALLHRVDYRRKLIVCFLAVYPAAAIASLAFPEGPYAQGGVVTLPIFVLVLLGPREARVAVLASAAIILSAPLMRAYPDVVRALRLDPVPVADPAGLLWFRTAVKFASLTNGGRGRHTRPVVVGSAASARRRCRAVPRRSGWPLRAARPC